MASIELDRVRRVIEGHAILDEVSFSVDDGEFIAVIGGSGAGKTSVLRAIAGFDELTSGVVRFDGVDVTAVPTNDRDIAMVSQHNTLFPTHKVRANLLFPLRHRSMARREARKRVEAESRAHDIEHIMERWPETLSGGEQQLAQIARALVRMPKVLLMDEPLAKLDVRVRNRMRRELVELQQGYGVTLVYASNRPEEILTMPSRVVALHDGAVVQMGTPSDVRARPANVTLAELTGHLSRLAVSVESDTEGYWITGDGIRMRAWAPELAEHAGRQLTLGVRTEDVHVGSNGPITMVSTSATFVESQNAMMLQSSAGTLHTFDTGIGLDTETSLVLDKWLLFDQGGQLILSYPT